MADREPFSAKSWYIYGGHIPSAPLSPFPVMVGLCFAGWLITVKHALWTRFALRRWYVGDANPSRRVQDALLLWVCAATG